MCSFSDTKSWFQDNYTFAQPGIQNKVKALEELVSRMDGQWSLQVHPVWIIWSGPSGPDHLVWTTWSGPSSPDHLVWTTWSGPPGPDHLVWTIRSGRTCFSW